MTGTVFILDASLTVRMHLCGAFERAGFTCIAFGDIVDAEKRLSSDRPSLLVIDLEHGSADVADFAASLQSRWLGLPTLLLGTETTPYRDGTIRCVRNPLDDAAVVQAARELLSTARPTAATAPSVLVIDDSLTYREQLSEALRRAGYVVFGAETGETGLEVAFTSRPTAIVVDNILPGIDGATVLRRLRQNVITRRTPALLLTASEDPREELRALEAGADSFVRKSQDLDVVLACLSAVLRSAAAPAALESLAGPQRPKVVVIDPDAAYATELLRALRQEGVEAAATNGSAILSAIGPDVDAVVLGAIPEATIRSFAQQIKSTHATRNVRLIVVASAPDAPPMVPMLNAGIDDYILRSAGNEPLLARVRGQIRRKQLEDENRAIRERILRQQLEAQAQRDVAEARAARAEELRQAKEVAEEKARDAERSAAQLSAVFSSMAEGIIIARLDGMIAYMNESALLMYRADPTVIGQSVDELRRLYEMRRLDGAVVPEDQRPIDAALRGETLHGMELHMRRRDYDYSWIASFNATPVKTNDGRHILAAVTVRDITTQKKAEDALRRSEKLAATGRLAASIAHEINNPLEAVTNLLYLLETRTGTDDISREYLEMAQRELRRVTDIARQTLAFYRDTADPVDVNVCALVREVAGLYTARAEREHVRLETDLCANETVRGFPGELRQVLSNFVANALDAAPKGGVVRVRVEPARDWSDANCAGIRITVADNGHGIPRQLRTEIFNPFFTTKGQRGTGLGLWVSSSIIEKHRGKVHFRTSTLPGNSGTTFSIFFPFHAEVKSDANDDVTKLMQSVARELLGNRNA